MRCIRNSVICCLSFADCLVRTDSVLPVRRGSEHLKWQCESVTKCTTLSVSNAQPVRSISVLVTATCLSTQTLYVSRTFLSGPNSAATYGSFLLKTQTLVFQKSPITTLHNSYASAGVLHWLSKWFSMYAVHQHITKISFSFFKLHF